MARHSLSHTPRCPFYPTREATQRCERCFTLVSSQALEENSLGQLCPRCVAAEELAAQVRADARITPTNLWRRFCNINIGATLIGVIVVGFLLAAGGYLVWVTAKADPDPLLIRRARVGFTHNFSVDNEGIDFIEVIQNGVVSSSSQSSDPLHTIERLHDGLPDAQVPPWRSGDSVFPIDIRLATVLPEILEKVVIWNHPAEHSGTYIQDFEIYVTVPGEDGQSDRRELAARYSALPVDTKQVFLLEAPLMTQVTVIRILGNHGGPYVSAAEIGLFGPTMETGFGDPIISQGPLP